MPDLSVFQRFKTKDDFAQAEAEFNLRKQLAQSTIQDRLSGGSDPAAIQIANAMAEARAAGDVQRMNDIALAAKSFDKGVIQNADGSVSLIGGYAPAVGTIAEAKQTGKNISDMAYKPAIAGRVSDMQNLSDQQYGAAIEQARTTGRAAGEATGAYNKKVTQAGNVNDLISQAEALLPKATSGRMDNLGTQVYSFFGGSDAETQADASLDLISGGLTSNVPRMEGPQGVLDVELYKQMAADVGNRNKPTKDRQAALAVMKQLNAKYSEPQIPQMPVEALNSFPQAESLPPQLNSAALPVMGALKPGMVEDGHMYVGGDPGNPASWKRVQ